MNQEQKAIQPPVEVRCAQELAALAANDRYPKPTGWMLSPRAVVTFIIGSGKNKLRTPDGDEVVITPKFVGSLEIVQVAVATLASDRALLLVGEQLARAANGGHRRGDHCPFGFAGGWRTPVVGRGRSAIADEKRPPQILRHQWSTSHLLSWQRVARRHN